MLGDARSQCPQCGETMAARMPRAKFVMSKEQKQMIRADQERKRRQVLSVRHAEIRQKMADLIEATKGFN